MALSLTHTHTLPLSLSLFPFWVQRDSDQPMFKVIFISRRGLARNRRLVEVFSVHGTQTRWVNVLSQIGLAGRQLRKMDELLTPIFIYIFFFLQWKEPTERSHKDGQGGGCCLNYKPVKWVVLRSQWKTTICSSPLRCLANWGTVSKSLPLVFARGWARETGEGGFDPLSVLLYRHLIRMSAQFLIICFNYCFFAFQFVNCFNQKEIRARKKGSPIIYIKN